MRSATIRQRRGAAIAPRHAEATVRKQGPERRLIAHCVIAAWQPVPAGWNFAAHAESHYDGGGHNVRLPQQRASPRQGNLRSFRFAASHSRADPI